MWLMTLDKIPNLTKNIPSGQKSHYFVFCTFLSERVTMWTVWENYAKLFFLLLQINANSQLEILFS